MKRRNFLSIIGASACFTAVPITLQTPFTQVIAQSIFGNTNPPAPLSRAPFSQPEPWAEKLITVAEGQIGQTTRYDGSYAKLDYPGGDIPREIGVCTDVIIRAYRDAFNIDLQKLVHQDMRKNFAAYPTIWGLKNTDRNIDHRRVPNLEQFFNRQKARVEITDNAKDYLPGDMITSRLPGNLPHIAIVTQRPNSDATRPLIVHNIGAGTRLEDGLFDYKIVGHYRYKPRA